MKAYLNLFKLRVITNIQYRLEVIVGVLTQAFFGFVFLMIYLAFYKSNDGSTVPMNWNNLVCYIWLCQAFYALIYPTMSSSELMKKIRTGDLAYELIRPQSIYVKNYFLTIYEKLIKASLRCLPIIVLGFILPYPYKMSLPVSIEAFIVFFITLMLACLLVSALIVLIQFLCMFTLDEKGLMNFYMVIAEIFMGELIPLPFLPNWLQAIAKVLPFRFIADVPFRFYSGEIPITEASTLIIGSITWIIVIIILGNILSKLALRKAVIQGG